jgi:Ca2+-binding RTX toxin-like protein
MFADGTAWDAATIGSMINNAPFLVTNVPDATATVNQALTYAISPDAFADMDVGDSLSYSVTYADGTALPSWLTFDPNTLTLSGTPTSTAVAGIHDLLDLTVTATDHAGATAQDTFTLTVKPIGLTLDGTSGNDTLVGNDGDDTISGLAGADRMTGGWGDDTYVVDNTGDVVVENAGEGTDAVQSSISYTLGTNVENLTLTGSSAINATGNASDNVIIGNAGNNTLNGLSGADTMSGGQGNDTYVVQSTGDAVIENAGEGTDTVQSTISYTLADNVENLTLIGTSAVNGTGNGLDNAIKGNAANNLLTGGEGSDVFVFNTALGATNVDTITDYTSGSDSMQLALAMFGGIGATGALSATAFVSGAGLTAATTEMEHVVYDTSSGMLYYDADGAGGAASVAFATLTDAPALTAADFAVV